MQSAPATIVLPSRLHKHTVLQWDRRSVTCQCLALHTDSAYCTLHADCGTDRGSHWKGK